MKDVFKELIIEFHTEAIPKPIHRDIKLPELPSNVRKAFVYIGMRRSGKTWALYQRMHELMSQGVAKSQLLYINFEDDRLNLMTVNELQLVLDAYWELYPEHIHQHKLYFFFDEIAEIDGWEKFIRRLIDKESMQIYVSGSSAKMLSKEISTNLRGRTMTREIFPLSCIEYLKSENIATDKNLTSKQQAVIQHHLGHYLQWGGFPETLNTSAALHREILQGYMDSVIYRDIIERHQVKNTVALQALLLHTLQNAANLLSINKFFNQLQSRGIRVSKDSLYTFIDYFEDAYALFSISVYTFSLNKAHLKPKKIYPIDTGLMTAYSLKLQYDAAARLETSVFLHLRRQYNTIHYFQTHTGREVDFLTISPAGKIALYQVSLSLTAPETRQREITALNEAMSELSIKHSIIVTMDESQTIETPHGIITVMPLSAFLLR